MEAGFGISAAFPIKAEMSVAMPKHQAKEPIDLDIVVVCRKRSALKKHNWNGDLWGTIHPKAASQVARLRDSGRKLSRNDVRIIVMAQLIRQLSRSHTLEAALALLEGSNSEIEASIHSLHSGNDNKPTGGKA
jgi:adenine-specific DNA methylase